MKRHVFLLLAARAFSTFTAPIGLHAAEPFDYAAFLKSVRAPADFTVELAAGEPTVRFPMFACFDDKGRLYVAESSGEDLYAGLRDLTKDCRVSRLEDADGDGRFEKTTVFAEGVTFPMGLAWRGDRLYLADPPNLVALTDTDGDGRADRREVIISGFGHKDNGSLHGLTFGPDGLLYFTMGSPDGWKLPRGDGTFLEGTAGALFRCQPDGSRPEVVSRGFENLVEVEFMPGGEIVGTDNWFQLPAGGLRDALVDCAPGGLYPYAEDRGTPLPRTGITMPPLTLLPAVAHSGLMRARRSGLPPAWRGSLFVAEHNTRKVVRHELRREGSTFSSTPHDFVAGEHPDFHPSDVLEAPDGSLLIVDTGGWYVEHCPTGRIRDSRAPGGIYRVRWTKAVRAGEPLPDEERFAAIWKMGADELRAQLVQSAGDHLAEAQPTLAARVLASRREKSAADALAAQLDSTSAPMRRAAAEALAVCGSRSHAPRLAAALVEAGDDFEQHACIAALLALADEPFVRGLLAHESARARRAALHLLDQPPFGTLRFADLVAPLKSEDAGLRATAGDLLGRHTGWAGDALPWLRAQLAGEGANPDNAALSGLLTAFQTHTEIRALISELLDPTAATPAATRAFLLDLMPSLSTREPDPAWLLAIPPALGNPALRSAALSAAAAFPQADFEPLLTQLAADATASTAQRLLAARLATREPVPGDAIFALAIASLAATADAADRFAAVDLMARARLSPTQLQRLLAALRPGGPVAPDALLPAFTRAADERSFPELAKFFAAHLATGWLPDRATLDQALTFLPEDNAAPLRTSWEKNSGGALQRLKDFAPLLTGGDPERGREFFTTGTCAACHRVGQRGGVIGPDLTKIGAIRSGGDLLESILYPSTTFAQGYEPYLLTRRSGESLAGSLLARTPDAVTLRDAIGATHRIPAADITKFERQPLSAMPAGLEQLFTRDQLRDLLAYIQSLK